MFDKIKIFICIILLSGIYTAIAQNSVLDKKISINVKNEKISIILDKISKKADVTFSYNSKIINKEKRATLSANKQTIKFILKRVLQDNSPTYKTIGKQIVIYRPKKKSVKSTGSTKISIEGNITDKKSKEAIPYANIQVEGEAIGVVSNIVKIDEYFNKGLKIVLENNSEIIISRRRAAKFRELLSL